MKFKLHNRFKSLFGGLLAINLLFAAPAMASIQEQAADTAQVEQAAPAATADSTAAVAPADSAATTTAATDSATVSESGNTGSTVTPAATTT